MNLDEIILLFGGESALASALGCGPSTISNWKQRGVPKGRWVDLVELAALRGARLSIEQVRSAHEAIVLNQQPSRAA